MNNAGILLSHVHPPFNAVPYTYHDTNTYNTHDTPLIHINQAFASTAQNYYNSYNHVSTVPSVYSTPLNASQSTSAAHSADRVSHACITCKKSKAKCDSTRPCGRCVRTGEFIACI